MATRKTKRKRKRKPKQKLKANQLYSVTFGPPGCECALCLAGPIPIDMDGSQRDMAANWIRVNLRSDASTRARLPWTPRSDRIPPDTTASSYITLIMAVAPDLLDDGPCELVVNGRTASPDTLINEGDDVLVTRSPAANSEISSLV